VSDLLTDALVYVGRGLSCIPVTATKKPVRRIRWSRFTKRLPTEDEVRGWFARGKVFGIAVICGPISGGLAIRDFDDEDGYEAWKVANPALADTLPTVSTFRGYHVWCRSDHPHIVDLGDGEFRGAGYTIAPHSQHQSGHLYEWINPLPDGPLPMVKHQIFVGELLQNAIGSLSGNGSVTSFPPTGSVTSFISATLPQRRGQRHNCLFRLARGLKFNCGMANATNDALREIATQWHQLALPVIGTKDFAPSWREFRRAFKRAVRPVGMSIVDAAAECVDPENLPPVAYKYRAESMRKLIAICYALASSDPDGGFFFSCHDAAPRIGVKQPMAVWRLYRRLEDDGVIALTERGRAGRKGTGRANRYRWIGGT
jgi:hypothetical protein